MKLQWRTDYRIRNLSPTTISTSSLLWIRQSPRRCCGGPNKWHSPTPYLKIKCLIYIKNKPEFYVFWIFIVMDVC